MSDLEDLLRRGVRDATPAVPLAPWGEIERRARRWHRSRWALRGAALGVLALVLAGALLFGGGTNGSGPSPIARAAAAVVDWPSNQILHVRMRMTSNFAQPDELEESWQLTSPPYTRRVVTAFPAGGTGAQAVESAMASDGTGQAFDWRRNEVVQTTGVGDDWRPTGVEQTTRDEMQALMANGNWKSIGESDIDGHHVVGFEAFGTARLYLDATTFLPVMDQSFGYGVGDERRGYDRHYTWELLPVTPANRALLDVAAQHPNAPVVTLPGPAWRALEIELGGLWKPPITPGA
jgi:hypothetical protein